MHLFRNMAPIALALALPLAACAKPGVEPEPTASGTETTRTTEPEVAPTTPDTETADTEMAPLDKGQLAKAVRLVDEAEIDLARIALERSQDEDVRRFAQRMLDEHGALDQRLETAMTMSRTAERDSDASTKLIRDANDVRSRISALQGLEFDRAYIDSQVTMHRDALGLLDAHLGSPETAEADAGTSDDVAKTDDADGDGVRDVAMETPTVGEAREAGRVRPVFEDARTMINAHLMEAERIQGSLKTRSLDDAAAPDAPIPETKGIEAPGG